MNSFCTYFDKNFIPQGISLIQSIAKVYKSEYSLHVLCLDETTHVVLNKLNFPNVVLYKESDLFRFSPKLESIKKERSITEYYYCFTPILIDFVMQSNKNTLSTTYVDADIYFFKDFSIDFEEYKEYDILLFEHGTPMSAARSASGIYNVGFNYFKNSENSRSALKWWTMKVFESTGRENGVWGDQKYLEEFPKLFKKIGVVNKLHLIAAPWNIMLGEFKISKNNSPLINGSELAMYHYARLLVINENIFLPIKRTKLSEEILEFIYTPYMTAINSAVLSIKSVNPKYKIGYTFKNWKGLVFSMILGRCFKYKKNKIKRIGFNIPFGYK